MATDRAGDRRGHHAETLDEQLLRKVARPIRSVHDLARPDLFESDEELEEFLEFTYASRASHS